MSRMGKLLDEIPYMVLVVAAIVVGMLPLGNPHLVEKTSMLFRGELRRAIDIFDLFMHSFPILLIAAKIVRDSRSRSIRR
jgi:hypothetical protein